MTRCFEPDEIAAALGLPEDDPARRHLESCPRCRNLVLAYYDHQEGLRPGKDGAVAGDGDLRGRLARSFDGRSPERRPWWQVDWPPWLWLTAAVTLVAALALLLGGQRILQSVRGPESGALRGALVGADTATGLQVEVRTDGLVLSWPAAAAAKAVIVFYDEGMAELGRVATGGTRLLIMADDPLAQAAACRLLRVAGSDTVGRSAVVVPAGERRGRAN